MYRRAASRLLLASLLCPGLVAIIAPRLEATPSMAKSVSLPASVQSGEEGGNFARALESAELALERGQFEVARFQIGRALERDPKALTAWEMRKRLAVATDDRDDEIYCLHRYFQLSVAQGAPKKKIKELRAALEATDPLAADLLGLKERFLDKLIPLAEAYDKDDRPHSAIRVFKEILALDPDNQMVRDAIERIASAPDPSLAADAKPKDLLADVSEEWVAEFDAKHSDWSSKAKEDRDNYTTYTDAGYEVMVRAAEAMEQMNAFYRIFFSYGTEEDGGSVPKISLHIFKDRDEYLEKGIGPPVEWSAGHFTGNAVETYIGGGGFEGMTNTLFHEAAHQFVSLATSASGWLNEGLASFFEGCRILANGTVIMNLPANHRLFPLASRMEKGWMTGPDDGLDPADPNATPETAPTFRIILENEYAWGPPWYAPTWGVVYFLYNYQDAVDGRFVYRPAFAEFIDSSGGRRGDGAVRNFEEVVLANPSDPTPKAEFDEALELPKTIDELNVVWKDWILELREQQAGRSEIERPYLVWAANAITRGELDSAAEHFEKALLAQPDSIETLEAFAGFLVDHRADEDRASQLMLDAIRITETWMAAESEGSSEFKDLGKQLRDLERLLGKWDSRQKKLNAVHEEIETRAMSIAERYLGSEKPLMAMNVSWRLGEALDMPELFDIYRRAVESSGKSLWIWKLAYNENNLDGWVEAGKTAFSPNGAVLESQFESANQYDYQFLALDTVTSGDFSLEAKVLVEKDQVGFAGLVFGKKTDQNFHSLVLYPPHDSDTGTGEVIRQPSYVDLTSFYGGGEFRIWRHVPVVSKDKSGASSAAEWHTLRIDIVGTDIDIWVDGEFSATQTFPDREVLRGGFGLLSAPGKARFRDVRYLDRPIGDPGAAVERKMRFQELAEAGGDTGSVSGSYLGIVPPLPKAQRWIGEELTSWESEELPTARLIVLCSILQNDLLPLEDWLQDLHTNWGAAGLETVAIFSALDADKIDSYLESHPFPGYVCVDSLGEGGIGLTFDDFAIDRFNLPRTLLVDVNGKVVWEGDPGFSMGSPFMPGYSTYLDSPLKELMETRHLPEHRVWRNKWSHAMEKINQGDFEGTIDVLREAADFDPAVDPEVARARNIFDAVMREASSPIDAGNSFIERDAAPALSVLLDWGALLGITVDKKSTKKLSALKKDKGYRDWTKAVKECERTVVHLSSERRELKLDELEAKLAGYSGSLVTEVIGELKTAREAGASNDELTALLDGVQGRPARWLAHSYFGW
jgi:tetratricopeptide (TPR) repeat protein